VAIAETAADEGVVVGCGTPGRPAPPALGIWKHGGFDLPEIRAHRARRRLQLTTWRGRRRSPGSGEETIQSRWRCRLSASHIDRPWPFGRVAVAGLGGISSAPFTDSSPLSVRRRLPCTADQVTGIHREVSWAKLFGLVRQREREGGLLTWNSWMWAAFIHQVERGELAASPRRPPARPLPRRSSRSWPIGPDRWACCKLGVCGALDRSAGHRALRWPQGPQPSPGGPSPGGSNAAQGKGRRSGCKPSILQETGLHGVGPRPFSRI